MARRPSQISLALGPGGTGGVIVAAEAVSGCVVRTLSVPASGYELSSFGAAALGTTVSRDENVSPGPNVSFSTVDGKLDTTCVLPGSIVSRYGRPAAYTSPWPADDVPRKTALVMFSSPVVGSSAITTW